MPEREAKLHLRTYRIGTPRDPAEGIRIGAVRYLPRGILKEDYARLDYLDVWFPILAPSRNLLQWARSRDLQANWKGFVQRHEGEMIKQTDSRQSLLLLARLAEKTPVSIGCYCPDENFCHRSIFHGLIERAGRDEL